MELSSTNFIVLDARLTPARRVPQADILLNEYAFQNARFILNRHGYNPNIVSEVLLWTLRKMGFIKPAFKTWSYATVN
jgi:hypothetical protein